MAALWLGALLAGAGAWGYELSGVVTGPDGGRVQDAPVWLWQESRVETTRTDATGTYAFKDVDGPARVLARREGLALGGADLQVLGDTQAHLRLAEAAPVSLRIVDQDHKPVAGASVKFLFVADTFGVPVWELVEHRFPSWRSDDDGVVTIPDLPKGAHFGIVVYHPGYTELRVPHLPPSETRRTLQVLPGIAVRGRVVSPDSKGVGAARVMVYQLSPNGRRDAAERFTDPEGYYATQVTPGDYFVEVRHRDWASPLSRRVTVEEGAPLTVDVKLLPPCRLTGTVMGPDGKPLGGVPVRYLMEDRFHSERLSRNDGSYELVVPTGEGALRVLPPPGCITQHWGDIPVRLERELRVDLKPILLKELPLIEGLVTADGVPQPQALISSRNLYPPLWAITDSEGRFRIRLAKPPEEPTASFRVEHGLRFLRKDFDVDLRADAKPVDVALEPFEPDLSLREPKRDGNDLTGLLDEQAPLLAVDRWFNSGPLTLQDLKGKVVVLTLWAGFDEIGPSRDRMYELCAIDALLEGVDDVAIVGIHDNGSEPEEIEQFIARYGIRFPVGRDVEAFTTYERYHTRVIPQTVLIDRAGRVRFVDVDGRLLELIKTLRREQ